MNNLINKYPEFFVDYEGNPGRVNWECPKGWYTLLDLALNDIRNYLKYNACSPVHITQVKEKFGTLRVYYTGGDDTIEGILSFLETMSEYTCENCGTNQNMGTTSGWISNVCETCKDKEPYASNKWKPRM